MNAIKRFIDDESGATAIEYALIAAFIGLSIMVGVTAFGTNLNNWYTSTAPTFNGLTTGSS